MRRTERIVVLTKTLIENPCNLFSLNYFTDFLNAAKSTISEDLAIIKETFQALGLGELETIAGAAGGIRYVPSIGSQQETTFLEDLSQQLATPDRIMPGGFLYMADLIYEPKVVKRIGETFLTKFADLRPEYIVTIETKGIPIALMVARAFGVPLVIVRDQSKVTEGSTVSINYVSGSSKRIQTMALSRRALPLRAKVIIIDDFMKAGGTAHGMVELMAEFEAEVLGVGVVVSTKEPKTKLVGKYTALLELEKIDVATKEVIIKPL